MRRRTGELVRVACTELLLLSALHLVMLANDRGDSRGTYLLVWGGELPTVLYSL